MNKRRFSSWLRKDEITAIPFLAPSLLGFSLFFAIPFAISIYYSFNDQVSDGTFVWFNNYKELLLSSSFRKAAGNTLLFAGVSVPLLIVLSLTLALFLNQRICLRNAMQTAIVLPLVVPVASIVMIAQIFIDWNGALNAWLHRIHLPRIDWLNSDGSLIILAMIYIWKNIGYNMILFVAGLQTIPRSYYETALVEGAGKIRRFTGITLVYLTPTMLFVILMSIVNSFKVFREIYLLAGPYPYDRIYMMQHYMNNMFFSLDIQKLTAAAVLMVGCMVMLVSVLLSFERRFQRNME
ncbi:multiple sugar transport system permease protein [Paenibacillus sp. UNCCL117]|uniref:carbohydrate ABC transporter permease n=1 Tax=unclassified Paenibacillus TaxID=185978 RepID=UPI00088E6FBD|nr:MULTISPECIES: sugar ABC transporter permease [unclassified Paenibacillus]SDE14587.1 multiple sugar transport system permease protein [Paenibacillus sp. cl123]SFW60643.1 multiple sugar transport system permease protein [Paenibacillus sp. UNCCL117]